MEIREEKIKVYITNDGFKFTDGDKAREHEKGLPFSNYYVKLDNSTSFDVTENHLKLVKRSNIQWIFHKDHYCSGHFYQDLTRPYGDSDWIGDIAEILGIKEDMQEPSDPNNVWFSDSLIYKLVCYNIDMKIVMEILCQNLELKVGRYIRSSSTNYDWVLSH